MQEENQISRKVGSLSEKFTKAITPDEFVNILPRDIDDQVTKPPIFQGSSIID
jgi:nicotinamide mononucleotide adenylyltransferase